MSIRGGGYCYKEKYNGDYDTLSVKRVGVMAMRKDW